MPSFEAAMLVANERANSTSEASAEAICDSRKVAGLAAVAAEEAALVQLSVNFACEALSSTPTSADIAAEPRERNEAKRTRASASSKAAR